eukprot:495989_1
MMWQIQAIRLHLLLIRCHHITSFNQYIQWQYVVIFTHHIVTQRCPLPSRHTWSRHFHPSPAVVHRFYSPFWVANIDSNSPVFLAHESHSVCHRFPTCNPWFPMMS